MKQFYSMYKVEFTRFVLVVILACLGSLGAQQLYACDSSPVISYPNVTDLGNGNFEVDIQVCVGNGGSESGWTTDFDGLNVISFDPPTLTNGANVATGSITGGVLDYNYPGNGSIGDVFAAQNTNDCFDYSVVVDGDPSGVLVTYIGVNCESVNCPGSCSVIDGDTQTGLVPPPAPLCGQMFYDVGGPNGPYPAGLNYTVTICSQTPGDPVTVDFTAFDLTGMYYYADFLTIYDGDDIFSPFIGNFTGTTSPGTVTSTGATGCLTFQFFSGYFSGGEGWEALVICGSCDLTIDSSTIVDVSCNGNDDGSISFTTSGGTPPLSYAWDNGLPPTENQSGLGGGIYSVTVSDIDSCTAVTTFTVNEATALTASASGLDASCDGLCDGSLSGSAAGGTPPYTYTWSTLGSGQNQASVCPGIYTLTVQDADMCTATAIFNVGGSTPITATTVQNAEATCNEDNGSATVNVSGGTAPYSYLWDNGETGQIAFNLNGGLHTVIITDAGGCTGSAQVTIGVGNVPSIDFADLDDPSSCGAYDGSIEIFASGGVPPLVYSNNNGMTYQSGTTFNGLGANTYNLVVMDAAGCYDTLIVDLVDPGAPTIDSIFSINPGCGEDDGFIEVLISGGNPNFEYSIDNGITFQGSNTFANLPAGIYEVIVEDFLGCRDVAEVTLFQAGGPVLTTADVTMPSCGNGDGTVFLNVQGGTAPYQYSVDGINYQTSAAFVGLAPGQYTFTVQDAAGCEFQDVLILTTDGAVILSINTTDPTFCDGNDGEISINANGGTPPYEYSINNGVSYQSSNTFTGLTANTFNVVVQDVNGCTTVEVIQLNGSNAPEITDVNTTDTACGEDNGEIEILITGGTPNFQYSIDGGTTFQGINTFTDLPAGTYDVVVTDNEGCVVTETAIINNFTAPEIDDLIVSAPSCGDANGSIVITGSGGTPPNYQYSIDGGMTFQTSSYFGNLGAGMYDIIFQDSEGCQVFDMVILSDAGAIQIDNIFETNPICSGDNGGITIVASGGSSPYQYSIDNGQTLQSDPSFSDMGATVYNILVEDANGCQITQILNFTGTESPEIDSLNVVQPECGENNGSIELFVSNGMPAYQYSIDGGITFQATASFEDLGAGVYPVEIEDFNGCIVTDTINLFPENAPMPLIIANGATTFCSGESVELYAGEFESYMWSTGDTVSTITVDASGNYSVLVTDAQGCEGGDMMQITVVPPVVLGLPATLDLELGMDSTISVIFPNPDLYYEWIGTENFSATGPSFVFNADQPGVYSYTVMASTPEGCHETATIVITVTDSSIFGFPNAFTPNNDGLNDDFGPVINGSLNIQTFKVFNRWGELIHDDPASRWDGTFRGEAQPQEVYVYMVVLTTLDGKEKTYTGDVWLAR